MACRYVRRFHRLRCFRRIPDRLLPAALLFLLIPVSCAVPDGGSVTFISWNVQTLFDAHDDGGEFPEYRGERWSEQLHQARLDRIARVLLSAGPRPPDIVALQEVESIRSLRALSEGPLAAHGYRWAVVPEQAPGLLGPAILSRLPVRSARAHAFTDGSGFSSRPILEIRIGTEAADDPREAGGEPAGGTLVLFNNHWKSRREGAEPTEPRRIADARILARRVREIARSEPETAILAVGDLNESSREYRRQGGRYPTALLPGTGAGGAVPGGGFRVDGSPDAAEAGDAGITLYDPLLASAGTDAPWGTYYHEGQWEDLDHVLAGPALADGRGLELGSVRVLRDPMLLDDRGAPLRWDIRSGRGISDHLPVRGEILTR